MRISDYRISTNGSQFKAEYKDYLEWKTVEYPEFNKIDGTTVEASTYIYRSLEEAKRMIKKHIDKLNNIWSVIETGSIDEL